MRTPGEILVQTAYRLYQDDPSMLKEYLAKRIDQMLAKRMSEIGDTDVETITLYVCEICNANPSGMKTKARHRELVEARAILYKILTSRSMFGWTLTRTAVYFGGRDHSTVIHGMKNYDDWWESDKVFKRKAELCIEFANKALADESTPN